MARKRKSRPRPLPGAPAWSSRRYLRLDRARVSLFRFFLESRDNLALFTVADPGSARRPVVLQLRYSPHQEREVDRFLKDIRADIPWEEVGVRS